MADCSKYRVEEAGFDISALKTSLIQYFRCRKSTIAHSHRAPAAKLQAFKKKEKRNISQVDRDGCCVRTGISDRGDFFWKAGRVKFERREDNTLFSGRCHFSAACPLKQPDGSSVPPPRILQLFPWRRVILVVSSFKVSGSSWTWEVLQTFTVFALRLLRIVMADV